MKLPVTESGVTLPKSWFVGATEVDVRHENGHVLVEPIVAVAAPAKSGMAYDPDDPVWQLGKRTSELPVTDASINLDQYLYGNSNGE